MYLQFKLYSGKITDKASCWLYHEKVTSELLYFWETLKGELQKQNVIVNLLIINLKRCSDQYPVEVRNKSLWFKQVEFLKQMCSTNFLVR